jgi:DNA-damage-inducible protein J
MDADIKKRFDAFCADAGMNATVAVTIFARAVLRERRIPFEITGSDDPSYSVKNQVRLTAAMEQLKTEKSTDLALNNYESTALQREKKEKRQ